MPLGQGVGVPVVLLSQQCSDQRLAFGPEGVRVIRVGLRRALPEPGGARVILGGAQGFGAGEHLRGRRHRRMTRVEPSGLSGCGGGGPPAQLNVARPFVVRGGNRSPALEKRGFRGHVVEARDPGLAREVRVRQHVGAAQQRARHRRTRGLALRGDNGGIGFGEQHFLPAAFQLRLGRPVGAGLDKIRDLRQACGVRSQHAVVPHQLRRDRIGQPGHGRFRLGPSVGADGGDGVRDLGARRRRDPNRRATEQKGQEASAHAWF